MKVSRTAAAAALAMMLLLSCKKAEDAKTVSKDSSSFYVRNEKKPRVIVFVHGVLGNPRETWTNATTGAFFPELVKADKAFDESDIFVYGFPSPKLNGSYNIDELSEHMRRQLTLAEIPNNYREVVFVCHSMGGLITRAFLLKYRDFNAKVPMIYFFSTPSTGSSLAAFARALGKNPQFDDMVGIADNNYLGSQQSSWLASPYGASVKSFCAYEILATYGALVVDRGSATNLCNVRLDPIAANHMDIVKPKDDKDEPFGALKLAYLEMFQAAGNQVELTTETLPNLLTSLRSPTGRQSYVVRTPVDISSLAGSDEQWYVMNLAFRDAGTLYVGSRDLSLDVRGKLDVGSATTPVFQSFPEAARTAASGDKGPDGANGPAGGGYGASGQPGGNGQPGSPGIDGLKSGRVQVTVRNPPTAPIRVALVGQNGGRGGDGGAGGNGGRGADGEPSDSGPFGCNRGGGNGGTGGDGGRGGDAGTGGNCGDGGEFILDGPDEIRTTLVGLVAASNTSAQRGPAGTAGTGGSPGGGGTMGRGGGFCGGGHGGGSGNPRGNGAVPEQLASRCSATRVVVR